MPVVQVYGADEAVAKLAKISAVTQIKVREVVKHAAVDTQSAAKRLCPVDTGRLRASIQTRSYDDYLSADVYTQVEYAAYVEYGTYKMAAEPYLGPAWDSIRPRYLLDLVEALRSAGEL